MIVSILKGNKVHICDQKNASNIHNRGFFGVYKKNILQLNLIEAVFLYEEKKISISDDKGERSLEEMLLYSNKKIEDFDNKYVIYRDLRKRGLVIDIDNHFLVYPRGKNQHNSDPEYSLVPISEGSVFVLDDVFKWSKENVVIGVVDEDSDITYYEMKSIDISGKYVEKNYGEGFVVGDRVLISDNKYIDKKYRKKIGDYVELSMIEAAYLMMKKKLKLKNCDDVIKYAKKRDRDFEKKFLLYKDLKNRNLYVRTGFRYGTHFRVYTQINNGHAPFLLHILTQDEEWQKISRAVRLAHGVRKSMVFARIAKNQDIEYIKMERFKP